MSLSLRSVSFDPLRDKSYQHTRLGRSVADFLAWKELGGAADRTLDQYERDLARGCLMFPDVELEDWSDTQLVHLAKHFRPRERRVRMAAWASFFKWARQTRRIDSNPMETMPDFKRPPKTYVSVFDEAEIDQLTGLRIRDGVLMQILLDAGLRKAEARHLQLKHVERNEIHVVGKGSKLRSVEITTGLIRRIDELAIVEGLHPDDYLWWSRPGGGLVISRSRPIGEGSFARWWRRCLLQAQVRYRNPHVARHTYATRWLRGGGRLSTLKAQMGHSSIATTDGYYGHLDKRDIIADLEAITRNALSTED